MTTPFTGQTEYFLAYLRLSDITSGETDVTVRIANTHLEGSFPLEESKLPSEDINVLLYLQSTRKGEEIPQTKIVAIDALYHEEGRTKNARIFGSTVRVPRPNENSVAGTVPVHLTLYKIPDYRRTIEVRVDRLNGELLFQHQNFFFDTLPCPELFVTGQLKVYRNGKLLDQTDRIDWIGNHGAFPAFCGLKQLICPEQERSDYNAYLYPDNFLKGDRLVLNVSFPREIDFESFLRNLFATAQSVDECFDEERPWTIEEMRESIEAKNNTTASHFLIDPVIRMRAKLDTNPAMG